MKKIILIIFLFATIKSIAQPDIKAGEYFIGSFDPGSGNGTAFTVIDGAWDEVVESILAAAQTIPNTTSPTLINVRLKDNSNNWGPLFKKTLYINGGVSNNRSVDITAAEYFFGVFDPGQGQGTTIIAFDGAFDDAVETVLRTNATWTVTNSPTLFNIRIKDAYGNWGPLFKKTIFPYGANPNAELIAQGSTLTVCQNSSVTLNYNGPNGYTPTWFNGTTGDSITFNVDTVGYYRVTATLGNSTYIDSIYIGFLPSPSPTITPSGSIIVCGSSAITLSTQVTTNTTFQWYYNGNIIGGATSSNYLPTQIGNYYVKATLTNNGCVGTSSTTKLVSTASITPSGAVTTCTSPVVLSAESGTGNTYQWKLNGVNISGATTPNYSATLSGNYAVTITNGSCASTSPITNLTISSSPPIPTITASGATTFCAGGSVTLTSSSQTGNTWNNGDTSRSITVINSGIYNVTVSNGSCTAISAPLNVDVTAVPSTPTITAGGATTFCSGGSVTLTSSSLSGNIWSNGATTQTITAYNSGNYSVTVSNGSCTATSSPITVTVNVLGAVGLINGNNAICTASDYTYTLPLVTNATNYTWLVPSNASVISGQGTNSVVIRFTSLFTSGNISVVASNSCQSSVPVLINVANSNIGTVGAITGTKNGVCPGSLKIYSIASVTNATNYTWVAPINSNIISGQGTTSIKIQFNSTFTSGTLSVSANNTCVSSNTVSSAINSLPSTPGTITGPATNLCGSTSQYSISAVTGATTYTWSTVNGGAISSGQGTRIAQITWPSSSISSASVCVTANNACGSSIAKCKTALTTLPLKPVKINGSTTVCANQTNLIYSIAAEPGVSYVWGVPAGSTIVAGQGSPTATINWGTASGSIRVTAYNQCGNQATKFQSISVTCRESELTSTSYIVPNPSNGNAVLYIPDNQEHCKVIINDLLGRVVFNNETFNDKLDLELNGCNDGLYLVSIIRDNNDKEVFKMIIEK